MKQKQFKRKWIFTLLTLILTASLASAEEDSKEKYQLEEIVVSATREEVPRQDVAASITAIDQEAIQNMPASTAGEVLQFPEIFPI
jgi:outer membrane cobalamin receptor